MARGQGLASYAGGGAQLGIRERRETSQVVVAGGFVDWGVTENALLSGGLDHAGGIWTAGIGGKYVFQETSRLVRPYVGAGVAIAPGGPFRPDLRVGLALYGFGESNLLIEGRWIQTASDFTVGIAAPF